MHSSLVRVQNVFGFFTTVAFTLGALIALSVVVSPQTPRAELRLRNVQVVKGRPHYYSARKEEYAHIKFDLDADLTSLFTWNTKQVFVYITATFASANTSSSSSSDSSSSEAIIWDAILPHPSAPEHANTYIHPSPSSSSSSTSRKSKLRAGLKSYPAGSAGPGILRLKSQKPKYQITTPWSKIGGLKDCRLHLRYNIQPWVGALTWSSEEDRGLAWKGVQGGESGTFEMPVVVNKVGGGEKGATKSRDDLRTETGAERRRGSPS
ncbi:hypothetical protein AAFC00_003285 [Neodothiora populina]|uniref:Signal peptidase subunit 3 n=1 Tax=Neodothiora populina TaxID=2781224 RepID=A0ABR3P9Y8_9PEZI